MVFSHTDDLQYSRMGQVMRRIHLQPLDKVPRDEEFQFRSRAKALVDKWDVILSAYKDVGPGTNGRARLTHGRSRSVASKIPVEIWRIVGEFFTSPIDLVNLAYVSHQQKCQYHIWSGRPYIGSQVLYWASTTIYKFPVHVQNHILLNMPRK